MLVINCLTRAEKTKTETWAELVLALIVWVHWCNAELQHFDHNAFVQVKIGAFITIEAGMVDYNTSSGNPALVLGIVIGIAALIAIVVMVIVCVYRRRAHASDQEVKNMQMQMSVMESKVAKVCKEGNWGRLSTSGALENDFLKILVWFHYKSDNNKSVATLRCATVTNAYQSNSASCLLRFLRSCPAEWCWFVGRRAYLQMYIWLCSISCIGSTTSIN